MASLFVKSIEHANELKDQAIEESLPQLDKDVSAFNIDNESIEKEFNAAQNAFDIVEEVATVNILNEKVLRGEDVSIESYPNPKLMINREDKLLIKKHQDYTQYTMHEAWCVIKDIKNIRTTVESFVGFESHSPFLDFSNEDGGHFGFLKDTKKFVHGIIQSFITAVVKLLKSVKEFIMKIFNKFEKFFKWSLKILSVFREKENIDSDQWNKTIGEAMEEQSEISREINTKFKDNNHAKVVEYLLKGKSSSDSGDIRKYIAEIEDELSEVNFTSCHEAYEHMVNLYDEFGTYISFGNEKKFTSLENKLKDLEKYVDDDNLKEYQDACNGMIKIFRAMIHGGKTATGKVTERKIKGARDFSVNEFEDIFTPKHSFLLYSYGTPEKNEDRLDVGDKRLCDMTDFINESLEIMPDELKDYNSDKHKNDNLIEKIKGKVGEFQNMLSVKRAKKAINENLIKIYPMYSKSIKIDIKDIVNETGNITITGISSVRDDGGLIGWIQIDDALMYRTIGFDIDKKIKDKALDRYKNLKLCDIFSDCKVVAKSATLLNDDLVKQFETISKTAIEKYSKLSDESDKLSDDKALDIVNLVHTTNESILGAFRIGQDIIKSISYFGETYRILAGIFNEGMKLTYCSKKTLAQQEIEMLDKLFENLEKKVK